MVADVDALKFHRDGFLVLRGVFDREETTQLRKSIEELTAKAKQLGHVLRSVTDETVPAFDLLSDRGTAWLVSDRRIVEIARRLIGRDDLVYFGDSGTMVGGKLRGFHKDNAVRDDEQHSDWQSPYTLIRFGIYLQDHVRFSGGLKVRRGSHMHADVSSGSIVDVATRPGDVVVWSLRTTHSGHAVRVKGLPFVRLQPRLEARLPSWLGQPEPCERVAAFMTLGADDHHLRNYVAKHSDLASYPDNYMYKAWLRNDGRDETVRRLADAGVKLLKPIPEYGSQFGMEEQEAGGYVRTGPSKPDVYTARGLEAAIQRSGKALRALGLA